MITKKVCSSDSVRSEIDKIQPFLMSTNCLIILALIYPVSDYFCQKTLRYLARKKNDN